LHTVQAHCTILAG